MIKILFICHGNICRSPMAEFILKDMVKKRGIADQFRIDSCATSREEIGNNIYPPARRKLQAEGIRFENRRARQLTKEDYADYDYLICMDRYNINNILRIIGKDPHRKIHMLLDFAGKERDITDPWYSDNFDAAFDDIEEGCKGLLEQLGIDD